MYFDAWENNSFFNLGKKNNFFTFRAKLGNLSRSHRSLKFAYMSLFTVTKEHISLFGYDQFVRALVNIWNLDLETPREVWFAYLKKTVIGFFLFLNY